MLELDECNQLLVTNPFADDKPIDSSSNHPIFPGPSLTLCSSEHHPLHSPSLLSPRTQGRPSEAVTEYGLMRRLGLDGSSTGTAEEDHAAGAGASEASQASGYTMIHQVGPNDSFAGVALRYGTSIAALRRANQLWPSDPIYLRTELLIPRGETARSKNRTRRPSMGASLHIPVVPPSDASPDFVASFVAARNMILSVLPARISLDSLSSRTSATEDHELDDLPTTRMHNRSAFEGPFAEDGHELSVLATPHAQQRLLSDRVELPSQVSCSFPKQDYRGFGHVPSLSNMRSRSMTSLPTGSLNPRRRAQPFSTLPIRTLQLEPEPAMELPVRRPIT